MEGVPGRASGQGPLVCRSQRQHARRPIGIVRDAVDLESSCAVAVLRRASGHRLLSQSPLIVSAIRCRSLRQRVRDDLLNDLGWWRHDPPYPSVLLCSDRIRRGENRNGTCEQREGPDGDTASSDDRG